MVLHSAVSVITAHGLSVVVTRVLASVCVTGLVVGALVVALALSSLARDERVSDETSWAGADGTVVTGAIETWCAVSLRTARVGVAQVGGCEWSASIEGMTGITSGA